MKMKCLPFCLLLFLLALPAAAQTSAADWYEQGKQYYNDKRYHAAIDSFTQALAKNPDTPDYYQWRGYSFYRLRDYDQALQDFNKAITLKDDEINYFYIRGFTHYRLENYSQSVADFTRAIGLDAKYRDGELFFWRARARSYLKADERTADDYTKALEYGYDRPYETYIRRGRIYEALEKTRAALRDYAIARDLQPESSWAYEEMGELLYALKRYTPAEKNFRRALQLSPDRAESSLYLGLIDLLMGRYDDAERRFSKASKSKNESEDSIHNLASVYLLTNRARKCSDLLSKVLKEKAPQSTSIYTVMLASFSLSKQGKAEEAAAVIDKAIQEIGSANRYYPLLRYLKGDIAAENLPASFKEDVFFWTTSRAVAGLHLLYSGRKSEALPYLRSVAHRGENVAFSTMALLEYRNLVAEDPALTDVIPAAVYFVPDPVGRGEWGRLVVEYIPFPGDVLVDETWTIHSAKLTSPPLRKKYRITREDHRQVVDFRIPQEVEPGLYELRLEARYGKTSSKKSGEFRIKP